MRNYGMIAAAVGCMGWLGAACADGGAASGDGAALQTVQARIVGGQAETGFAAVGALTDNGEAFCTGTLVAPQTVVTAAHCVEGGGSPAGMAFFVGPNANQPGGGTAVAVASVHPHPQYGVGGELANDIAVVKLAEAPPVTPIPLLAQPMDDGWVGRSAVFVGYGVTSAAGDDAGLKRSVAIDISAVRPTDFEYRSPNKNTCYGDSGGPALATVGGQFHLIGVTSWGDEGCAEFGVNTRTDAYGAFISGLLGGDVTAPPSVPSDPGSQDGDSDDICDAQGWYGDGICDIGCANPDPDCGGETPDAPLPDGADDEDYCAIEGWYGDGVCDLGCANPDPDCAGLEDELGPLGDDDLWSDDGGDDWSDASFPHDPDACDDDAFGDPAGGDWGDTHGDDFGPSPDDEGDICAAEGWYGDGICDEGCANPDPDC